MSNQQSAARRKAIGAPEWDADRAFLCLRQVARRRLLVKLADGEARTGAELLNVGRGRGRCTDASSLLSATLKNLAVMVDAGFVVPHNNASDGRRTLYRLAPGLKVTHEEGKTVLDFGVGVVRLSPDGN